MGLEERMLDVDPETSFSHNVLTCEFQSSAALSRRVRPGSDFFGSCCSSTMSEAYL
jgi:hypothetical protein